jgi:hypothetical protein
MDDAGKFSLALYAVLYAARNTGSDLEVLLRTVKRDIVGYNSIRPLPQDQDAVIKAIEVAIDDISR